MSLVKLKDAARELAVSIRTIKREVQRGALTIVEIRGAIRIDPRDLKSLGFAAVPVRPRLRVPQIKHLETNIQKRKCHGVSVDVCTTVQKLYNAICLRHLR